MAEEWHHQSLAPECLLSGQSVNSNLLLKTCCAHFGFFKVHARNDSPNRDGQAIIRQAVRRRSSRFTHTFPSRRLCAQLSRKRNENNFFCRRVMYRATWVGFVVAYVFQFLITNISRMSNNSRKISTALKVAASNRFYQGKITSTGNYQSHFRCRSKTTDTIGVLVCKTTKMIRSTCHALTQLQHNRWLRTRKLLKVKNHRVTFSGLITSWTGPVPREGKYFSHMLRVIKVRTVFYQL